MIDINLLRDDYRARKAELFGDIATSGQSVRGIHSVMRHLAREADQVLKTLWKAAALPEGFALAAVGGFGRGELFPYSDVDVLVLMPDRTRPEVDPELKEKLERFIGNCWDAGLEIGSSVRTVSECLSEAAKDVTVQTSLLEARLVTGSRKLYMQFRAGFEDALDARAFYVCLLYTSPSPRD